MPDLLWPFPGTGPGLACPGWSCGSPRGLPASLAVFTNLLFIKIWATWQAAKNICKILYPRCAPWWPRVRLTGPGDAWLRTPRRCAAPPVCRAVPPAAPGLSAQPASGAKYGGTDRVLHSTDLDSRSGQQQNTERDPTIVQIRYRESSRII